MGLWSAYSARYVAFCSALQVNFALSQGSAPLLCMQVKIARTIHHKNIIKCIDVLVSRSKVCRSTFACACVWPRWHNRMFVLTRRFS
jgi:hypothetical protein